MDTRWISCAVFLCFFSCHLSVNPQEETTELWEEFDVQQPVYHHQLQAPLQEISGVAHWKAQLLLAINDEQGRLFLIDGTDGSIINSLDFAENGDYEAICKVNQELWVLRSDGQLYQLKNWQDWQQNLLSVQVFDTPLRRKNNVEGLCYDSQTNSLLMACKEHPFIQTEDNPEIRTVYQFSLSTKSLLPQPKFQLLLGQLSQHIPAFSEQQHLDLLVNQEGFRPSEIAIHPHSKEIYLASAKTSSILVLSPNGIPRKLIKFPIVQVPQLEALSFDKDGHLWCASEAAGREAQLWKYYWLGPADEGADSQ